MGFHATAPRRWPPDCDGPRSSEFPGAHNGWLVRPREFAARLLQALLEYGDHTPPTGDRRTDTVSER